MTTQDYGLARRMWHRLAARGPVAITDDDLFEVLNWVANGILGDFPPAVRDACWRHCKTHRFGASGPPER